MYKNYKLIFSLSNSMCRFPVPRQEPCLNEILNLNNQTLKKDRPTYVNIFKLFRLNRRFLSSQEVLQNDFVSLSLFSLNVSSGKNKCT